MKITSLFWKVIFPVTLFALTSNCASTNETEAQIWINELDKNMSSIYNDAEKASWNYATNLTDHNSKLSVSKFN